MLEGSGESICGQCKGRGAISNWLWFRKLCTTCNGQGTVILTYGSSTSANFDVQHPPGCPAKCFWSESRHGMQCPQGGCVGTRLQAPTDKELSDIDLRSINIDAMLAEGFSSMLSYLAGQGVHRSKVVPQVEDFLVAVCRRDDVYITTERERETTASLLRRLALLKRNVSGAYAELLSITYTLHLHCL